MNRIEENTAIRNIEEEFDVDATANQLTGSVKSPTEEEELSFFNHM